MVQVANAEQLRALVAPYAGHLPIILLSDEGVIFIYEHAQHRLKVSILAGKMIEAEETPIQQAAFPLDVRFSRREEEEEDGHGSTNGSTSAV